uniref:Uncharacterized protein n=1 Tax=Eutreptiella gymnastica TaxID=73025 RepID=A0A7S1NNT6_9EUGL
MQNQEPHGLPHPHRTMQFVGGTQNVKRVGKHNHSPVQTKKRCYNCLRVSAKLQNIPKPSPWSWIVKRVPVAGGHLHTIPGWFGAIGGACICVGGNSVQPTVVPSKAQVFGPC